MMCIREDCKGITLDREWFRLQSFVVIYYLGQRSVLGTVHKVHTKVPRALAALHLRERGSSLNGSRGYKGSQHARKAFENKLPVVGIAFVTTISGISFITNTQPKQSLITTTSSAITTLGSAIGQVAITEGNTSTTLKLAGLPTASLQPQPSGIQVVSESGSPVVYSPLTLSTYFNTEPVEISTNFVDVINGQTTTKEVGGLWKPGVSLIHQKPGLRRMVETPLDALVDLYFATRNG